MGGGACSKWTNYDKMTIPSNTSVVSFVSWKKKASGWLFVSGHPLEYPPDPSEQTQDSWFGPWTFFTNQTSLCIRTKILKAHGWDPKTVALTTSSGKFFFLRLQSAIGSERKIHVCAKKNVHKFGSTVQRNKDCLSPCLATRVSALSTFVGQQNVSNLHVELQTLECERQQGINAEELDQESRLPCQPVPYWVTLLGVNSICSCCYPVMWTSECLYLI